MSGDNDNKGNDDNNNDDTGGNDNGNDNSDNDDTPQVIPRSSPDVAVVDRTTVRLRLARSLSSSFSWASHHHCH